MESTQVLIVGAGPVGLTLAIDLGQRGIRCMVIERNSAPGMLPKMERCNARTMEIYRRLGIAEQIRAAGYPPDAPMDVFIVTDLNHPPILHLPYPSVAELAQASRELNDGSLPAEPYQLISQFVLEPVLLSVAQALPAVSIRFSHEFVSLTQDDARVVATVKNGDGHEEVIEAQYLAGCDGGASAVRKQLGIRLEGEANILRLRQALFRCEDLYDRIPMGKGRHYHVADDRSTMIVVQSDRKHFTLHSIVDTDEDMVDMFRKAVGMPIDFETLYVGGWTQHLLVANSYGSGRVWLAGDAAHLVIPTGGLGMNTGIGDATDLAWKLAAILQGWGGPDILASYEKERRQIGLRNVNASHRASKGRTTWRAAFRPEIADDTPAGKQARQALAQSADVEQRKTNEITGIEMGYRYLDTPIVCTEDGGPEDSVVYQPTTWPGARLPNVWLDDGSAAQDKLGKGYTLLCVGGEDRIGIEALAQAMAAIGAPFASLVLNDAAARRVYEYRYLLVRPDLHIVWRANELPADVAALAARVTGWASARSPHAASDSPGRARISGTA